MMGEERLRDNTKTMPMKIIQSSKPPPLLFIYIRNSSVPLVFPISKKRSSLNDAAQVNERNQKENKIKSCHIQTDHVFYFSNKQCNDIIKGWLHWLRPESKRRFLINNIPYPLPPLRLITCYFCLIPPPPSKWTSYVYHTLTLS